MATKTGSAVGLHALGMSLYSDISNYRSCEGNSRRRVQCFLPLSSCRDICLPVSNTTCPAAVPGRIGHSPLAGCLVLPGHCFYYSFRPTPRCALRQLDIAFSNLVNLKTTLSDFHHCAWTTRWFHHNFHIIHLFWQMWSVYLGGVWTVAAFV